MTLIEIIKETYPELTDVDFGNKGAISLRNDGFGDYIEKWEYTEPIPKGLKLGKPTAQHNLRE